ncbi:tRNA 2-selenouridine(34) synthase MnmH [Flavipsychrobacter stenotrophus]|uniref:tRNA 2-selenouridine(34) synthase MnmH n=1 Tax=Flavipsychrobacter stenotrophus TaxID=2077091 RepID=A0A2S7T0S0_9BACT|nr:tRNA 2-selenouridine(34) synthase MnmH [Flavipsychrobacter stenotrophus]PQJ12528.1 tRNA 2-selenouridine(34) synthase MnmH [Flavipsychrobacter stenotrophus]
MIHHIDISEFIELAQTTPIFDVRSPGEYDHAHIPNAYSLPLFSNEERKVVGTAYKQQSREDAIKIGLDFYGVKMRGMVEEVERIIAERNPDTNDYTRRKDHKVLVHCWRGGMRSAGVSWLLDLYGFNVYMLKGGYKAYRNWALQQFDIEYPLNVLGGYTGSGKTEILGELEWNGNAVIDLEAIAKHKGSAFGGFDAVQPSQEMFENELALVLYNTSKTITDGKRIWVEDESQRVGLINLPGAFYKTMVAAPLYFLDVPFEQRVNWIVEGYGKYTTEELINAIVRIKKRLGGQDTKNAINALVESDLKTCFAILLRYYDKYYGKGLAAREKAGVTIYKVSTDKVDAAANSKLIT